MDPKKSGKFIADEAEHVKIKDEGIEKCAQEIVQRVKDKRLSLSLKLYKDAGVHPVSIKDEDVEWVFWTSALNFSFWTNNSEPQYLVTYQGKRQHGYMSMCAAINRTLERVPMTDPDFYGKVSKEELNTYLMGDDNVPIPMLEERVRCLHGKTSELSF